METKEFHSLVICLAIFLWGFSVNAHARSCVAAGNGAWESITWTNCTSGPAYPNSSDTASIGNHAITIPTGESDAASSLTFTANGGSLAITSTGQLTVSGAITMNSTAGTSNTTTLSGTGTISAGSIQIGSTVTPSSTKITLLISTISTLTVSGGVTLTSFANGSSFNNPELELEAGSLSTTSITTSNPNASNTAIIDMAAGAGTGTLNLSAASPWVLSGTGTNTTTLTQGTVDYTAATGGQTVLGTSYDNLTLNNTSGTDTASAAVVLTGTLTISSGGTFDMSTFKLSGAFTPANSGTLKTSNTSNPAITSGLTWGGTVQFAATTGAQSVPAGTYTTLTFSNTSGTDAAKGVITATTFNTTSGGIVNMATFALTVTNINNSGTIKTTSTANPPLTVGLSWGGTVQYDSTSANQTIAYGTYTNLTIADAGQTAALGGATTVSGILTVSSGTFDQGASYNLTTGTGALTINSGATMTNNGTGDLIVGSGGVSNAGIIEIDGSGLACSNTQSITITSSSPGTQQSWAGSGAFYITDVTVQDQSGSATIVAYGSSSVSNNGSNWTITTGCPPSYFGGNGDGFGMYDFKTQQGQISYGSEF